MASDPIISSILRKTGIPDLVERLSEQLTGSELNSLLLEVFNKKVSRMSPAELLRQYETNRFVQPSPTDMTGLLEKELQILRMLRHHHFQPVELSPVAPLGSCSVVGTADQRKIISALRNTEVLADATNAIALHIAQLRKNKKEYINDESWRFCTAQRHLRAPKVQGRGLMQHFKIGCLVSSGMDTGNYAFECKNLAEHFSALYHLMEEAFDIKSIFFKLQSRAGYKNDNQMIEKVYEYLKQTLHKVEIKMENPARPNNYYKGIQFKMVITVNDQQLEIADGGFVDWTQQLLGNKKERLLISGFGLELLYNFQNKLQ